jgi:hypothetical protein
MARVRSGRERDECMASDGHHLIIARRGEASRFATLMAAFAGEPEVTILWDRRQGERRQVRALGAIERRESREGAVPVRPPRSMRTPTAS